MCADAADSNSHQGGGGSNQGIPNDWLKRLLPKALKSALPSQVGAQTIDVYTRHGRACAKHPKNCEDPAAKRAAKYWKRCNCPKWIYVFHDGRDYRFSADTRSWENAERVKSEIAGLLDPDKNELRRLKQEQQAKRVRINYAVERYLADAASRNLHPDTQRIIRGLFRALLKWTEIYGHCFLDELTVDRLEEWRNTWILRPITKQIRQARVRTFFRFCVRRGWLNQNPASLLSCILVDQKPTDYFPPEEFIKIIDATQALAEKSTRLKLLAVRVRTLILLMRYSGLRIGDAITLERPRLVGNNIQLYQHKTGTAVFVPLPPEIAKAVRNVPAGPTSSPRYFFWNGRSRRAALAYWEEVFGRVFRIANIRHADGTPKRCHSRMLRDTFAVESILSGMRLEEVSTLLGHVNINTTKKHYLPWVLARQQQLIKAVEQSWKFQVIVGTERHDSSKERPEPTTEKTTENKQSLSQVAHEGSGAGVLDAIPVTSPNASTLSVEVINSSGRSYNKRMGKGRNANGLSTIRKRAVQSRLFPHIRVAQMYLEGKTARQIAEAIGWLDPGKDPTNTVRRFLYRMRRHGFKDDDGRRVKLPHR